ncbi:MAG: hypothetical protein LBL63_07125 [Clostridiales Family XIII bacterium]|jgi:hypothetical protein|nr:hypothetical protein [Clostridiales Family XIII bacterium]
MLTIGEPIKLNTGKPFTTFSPLGEAWTDPFFERIAGGYALMAMDFTPKDMLLLMFASPEISEFGGGITNIAEVARISNSRSFLLNIVNNVVNRVLLAEDTYFSYRDELYLSNVLRRIGVTDVNLFLREAFSVMEEGRTVLRLIERYDRNREALRERVSREAPQGADIPAAEASGGETANGETPVDKEAFFSEIMHRLGVDRIFSSLQSYGAYAERERVSSVLELNAAEWIGMLNAVRLFDLRREASASAFSPVHRHYNAYETGVAPEPEAAPEAAVGAAVAAAWINLVQNAFLARMIRAAHTDARVHVDVSRALPDAAIGALERFRSWHTERVRDMYAEHAFERRLALLDRLEERLLARADGEETPFTPTSLTLTETVGEAPGSAADPSDDKPAPRRKKRARKEDAAASAEAARRALEEIRTRDAERARETYAEHISSYKLSELDRLEERLLTRMAEEGAPFAPTDLTFPETADTTTDSGGTPEKKPAARRRGRPRKDEAPAPQGETPRASKRVRAQDKERMRDTTHTERVSESNRSESERVEEHLRTRTRTDGAGVSFVPAERVLAGGEAPGGPEPGGTPVAEEASRRATRYFDMLSRVSLERREIERSIERIRSMTDKESSRVFTDRILSAEMFGRTARETARIEPAKDRSGAAKAASGEPGGAPIAQSDLRTVDDLLSDAIKRGAEGFALGERAEFPGIETTLPIGREESERMDGETDEARSERLKAELDAYDRKNKEAARLLAERADRMKREETTPRGASGAGNRAAAEALGGLDDPERFLKELKEAAPEGRGERVAPQELTLLLSSVAPEYREIYERLLSDMREGEREGAGGIRPVSLPDFNAEIAASAREHSAAEIHHIERELRAETKESIERTERVIERAAPARGARAGEGARIPEPLHLFHRPAPSPAGAEAAPAPPPAGDVSRTSDVTTVREIVNRDDRIDTEVNRAIREVRVNNMREIDAAIDKALHDRMRMIEGRVYSGVERKLDMERARRGK